MDRYYAHKVPEYYHIGCYIRRRSGQPAPPPSVNVSWAWIVLGLLILATIIIIGAYPTD
jgi:hypothetical protein